jgi:hypothetical protein
MSFMMLDANAQQRFLPQLFSDVGWIERDVPCIKRLSNSNSNATSLNLTMKFLQKQDEFRRDGKPMGVQIAYHYTKKEKVFPITLGGLQTSQAVRGFYGNGIYVEATHTRFEATARLV